MQPKLTVMMIASLLAYPTSIFGYALTAACGISAWLPVQLAVADGNRAFRLLWKTATPDDRAADHCAVRSRAV